MTCSGIAGGRKGSHPAGSAGGCAKERLKQAGATRGAARRAGIRCLVSRATLLAGGGIRAGKRAGLAVAATRAVGTCCKLARRASGARLQESAARVSGMSEL